MFLLFASSWLLLQPGVLGKDERVVFQFTAAFVDAGFNIHEMIAAMGQDAPYGYFSHDFAWFLIQLIFYLPLRLASAIFPALNGSVATQFYMAAMLNLPVWLAMLTGWAVLQREGISAPFAALTVAAVFAGSYLVSVVPGSMLAGIEVLLICLQLLLGQRGGPRNAFLLGLCGGYMFSARLYALPAVLALAFLAPARARMNGRTWLFCWGGGVMLAFIVAFAVKLPLPIPTRHYLSEISPSLYAADFLPVYFERLAAALFSFAYGLVFTAPFLGFVLFAPDKRAMVLKCIALLLVLAPSLLYPFWAGETGVAGNRYILAYLLMLLPEAAAGFRAMVQRRRDLVLLVPLLILLFAPSLLFRANVTVEYAVGQPEGNPLHPVIGRLMSGAPARLDRRMSEWVPVFHPVLFGWWQAWADITGRDMILPVKPDVWIDPGLVPPYGLLPRLIFLDLHNAGPLPDPRVAAARRTFQGMPRWLLSVAGGVSILTLVGWLTLLVWGTHRVRTGGVD